MPNSLYLGGLFSSVFVEDTIRSLPDWSEIDEATLDRFERRVGELFDDFPTDQEPNEAETETKLIWPLLRELGWANHLQQQTLAATGRGHVPDGLLFEDKTTRDRASRIPEQWQRYELGKAIVESKRWRRPLDRQSGRRDEQTAPATQMLRYLRRVDDLTNGGLRWGILTNGRRWRIYYQGARSVAEQFFELDLGLLLGATGEADAPTSLDEDTRRHWLTVFLLVFGRRAFRPTERDSRPFLQRAVEEAQFYEQRVANDLAKVVFGEVFRQLVTGIAEQAPAADLQEVRDAALILLYRLLFILYAEDRDLLPVTDARYDDYGLRERVRKDVGARKDSRDTFSKTAARYWNQIDDLCRAINEGDASIGLPPYNGGLFDPERTPLLSQVRLGDQVMADVIDALSFETGADGKRTYINYRDLSVQQLGSIYERLIEYEVVREDGEIDIRPNVFARKGSGSYYTPNDLVGLIVKEAIDPLIEERIARFRQEVDKQGTSKRDLDRRLGVLENHDPASKILELKVCDPAMGSGHFLVNLVDYLSDRIIAAVAEAEEMVTWGDYVSPLTHRIAEIRRTILANAEERDWTVDQSQLDDRHIVRRMVLKRCVHGVDKNPMAVELAKVSLWLHTFTVGAPLSFLDHHLRCGDSLFGTWVRKAMDRIAEYGGELLIHEPMTRARRAAESMQMIERLTDAEIAEAHRSASLFDEVREMTAPLDAILSFVHALDWIDPRGKDDKRALQAFFDGTFGDPIEIVEGKRAVTNDKPEAKRFQEILDQAQALIGEQNFLNWQVAFPRIWSDWSSAEPNGGFDAAIGNPPWDRMKLQQVEWFAQRRSDIAMAPRAADRHAKIRALQEADDPLAQEYAYAAHRAETATRVARKGGQYPMLSKGDVNLYSLFVERAMTVVHATGMVGLLTPSGIASDQTASGFFKWVSSGGRLQALYDFENKKIFFPDVHASFKLCIFIASPSATKKSAQCAFFLHSVESLSDPDKCFSLYASDFARVNPNTGTAPIFRRKRDADITTAIYQRVPVLVDRSSGQPVKTWPVSYLRMFDMTNDSHLFRTRPELEEQEGAYPIGGNRWRGKEGDWVPLYEGKMVQAFDHRAASVIINPDNQHRPGQPRPSSQEQHKDPNWHPESHYFVPVSEIKLDEDENWVLGFKEITAPTNVRTFIAALLPGYGFGNKVPLLRNPKKDNSTYLVCAILNSVVFDYVARQKVHGQTLNWYIVEQLPFVPKASFDSWSLGDKTASDVVRDAVLELTYTAQDMAPFARDMGYVDANGDVKPPFIWDDARRLYLRAKLDALFFHLYGVTDRDDVRYIYSTFPIWQRQEEKVYGSFRSRELCLAWMNALAAGQPDADVRL